MKLSKSKQIALLRDLRRKCGFLYREGCHGYVCHCGYKIPNGPHTSHLPCACSLACSDLKFKAWTQGVDITIPERELAAM